MANPKFSRKHWTKIARALANGHATHGTFKAMTTMLQEDNPMFDPLKFKEMVEKIYMQKYRAAKKAAMKKVIVK